MHKIALTGLPSRARVSADGRYGAMTVFVTGDSYLESPTAFSTRTTIVDMATAAQIGQLEQFDVSKDGKPFDAVDFNFWGVTFAKDSEPLLRDAGHRRRALPGRRRRRASGRCGSCATASSAPRSRRTASRSPTRAGSATSNRWHLRVLDVATLKDHAVAENRSIDDQVEWLDDDTLAYSDGTNVYTVPADGSGEARLLVRDATSPVSAQEVLNLHKIDCRLAECDHAIWDTRQEGNV